MIIKRMMALLLALCLLLGTGALAEGELIIEEEIITDGGLIEEEIVEDDAYITDEQQERLDDLMQDVELDESVTPGNLEVNPNLPDHVVNILLVGIDTRENDLGEGLQHGDVQIILSVNKLDGSVKLTSIMRDLYVDIPGYRNKNRANIAYARGKGELAMRMVNHNFDMNIEYYATINFYGLASIIDAIGGIDIELTRSEAGAINAYIKKHPPKYDNTDGKSRVPLEKVSGVQHLDGIQAVMYARVRSIDNDFNRSERQRKLLELLLGKVMQDMDADKLITLMETALPYVETNMGLGTMFDLALCVVGGDIIERARAGEPILQQHRIPADETWKYYTTPGGAEVVAFRTSARKEENVRLLHEFIYGAYYPASAE